MFGPFWSSTNCEKLSDQRMSRLFHCETTGRVCTHAATGRMPHHRAGQRRITASRRMMRRADEFLVRTGSSGSSSRSCLSRRTIPRPASIPGTPVPRAFRSVGTAAFGCPRCSTIRATWSNAGRADKPAGGMAIREHGDGSGAGDAS
jgi:hypothetical protein